MKTWKIVVTNNKTKETFEATVEGRTFDSAISKFEKIYGKDHNISSNGEWALELSKCKQVRIIDNTLTSENSRICTRCNGTGFIPKFDQYNGGICYVCQGVGRLRNKVGK